jgi:orotidine-5'-phosphate decarboxylase
MKDEMSITAKDISQDDLHNMIVDLAAKSESNNKIPEALYKKYDVRRGLRNPNGTGVLVALRARQAVAAGCDGVIASGLEAPALRRTLGAGALIVTPGIRPADGERRDDQRRVVTPTQALQGGADYLVVGRPIRDAADPYRTAVAIQEEIARACG